MGSRDNKIGEKGMGGESISTSYLMNLSSPSNDYKEYIDDRINAQITLAMKKTCRMLVSKLEGYINTTISHSINVHPVITRKSQEGDLKEEVEKRDAALEKDKLVSALQKTITELDLKVSKVWEDVKESE